MRPKKKLSCAAATATRAATMAHSYTRLLYHLVWSTKHRDQWITEATEAEVHAYVRKLIEKNAFDVFAINGMQDHVHVIAQLKPNAAVAKVIQDTKAYSSG